MPRPNFTSDALLRALECANQHCSCHRSVAVGHGLVHCPYHDPSKTDRTPSLSVSERDGAVLWHCHNGCDQGVITDAIHQLFPIQDSRLPNRPANGAVTTQARATETVYDYGAAKHMRLDFPDGSKRMWWEPAGVPMHTLPLWNADLLKNHRPDEPVLLVEGEKSADAAVRCGFTAVSLPGGASQRNFGDAFAPLKGMRVVLIPDLDDPGSKLMDAVAPALSKEAVEISRSTVGLYTEEKGADVADLLVMAEGNERLAREMIQDVIEHAEPVGSARDVSRQTGEDFADLVAEADEPVVEFVPGLFNEGTYILAGAPKLGKSWLTLSVAQGLAMGGAVLGRIQVEACDVLYLCLEDGRRRFKRRAKMRSEGIALPERGRFEVHFTWPKLDDGGAERLEGWVAIRSAAGRRCCVVIDTGIRLRPGDSGKQGDMYRQDYEYLATITDIMQHHNALCIVVSHTRKAEALDFIDMVIGSHGITGAVEGVMVFTRERHSKKATLMGTDKDGEEIKVVLEWNDINGGWVITDSPDEATEQRQRVMGLIHRARAEVQKQGKPLTLLELRVALAVQRNSLVEALSLAVQWGLLTVRGEGKRGDPERYDLPGGIDTDSVPGIDTE